MRAWSMEASYKLAEELDTETTVTRRSQEPTNKQTPMIKGVLPDMPAPIAEPRPEGSRNRPANGQQRDAKPAATAAAPAPAAAPSWSANKASLPGSRACSALARHLRRSQRPCRLPKPRTRRSP